MLKYCRMLMFNIQYSMFNGKEPQLVKERETMLY